MELAATKEPAVLATVALEDGRLLAEVAAESVDGFESTVVKVEVASDGVAPMEAVTEAAVVGVPDEDAAVAFGRSILWSQDGRPPINLHVYYANHHSSNMFG